MLCRASWISEKEKKSMEPVLSINERAETKKNRAVALNFSTETFFIISCVLLAFLIRFALLPPDGVINSDGTYYASLGKRMISGDVLGGISAYWSPLYSLLIGISSLFFQDLEFAGRFVSLVAGTLLIIPSYFLIRNFYGRQTAYLGTILVVVHPSLIQSSGWLMTEPLYALIFITGLLTGSSALQKGSMRSFLLTGFLFGAAYLTKPESIGFIGLFFVLALGAKFFRRNLQLRRLMAGYFLFLLGFTIFFLPYVVILRQKTGSWTISQKLVSNISAVNSDKGLLELTDDGQTTMRDRLFGDGYETENQPAENSRPAASATNESNRKRFDFEHLVSKTLFHLKKQVREHIPAILPHPFILLAILGLFFRRWTRPRLAREIYLFSFVACTVIGYALTVIELRYLFAILPILLGWVSFGIVGLGNFAVRTGSGFWKTNRKVNPVWIQVLILIILSVSLKPLFSDKFETEDWQDVAFEEKHAGLWLKDNISRPSLIMASSAISAFYAEADHIYVPDEELSEVLEYAKRKKVNYLVLSQRRLKNTPRAFPAGERNLPEELKLIYKDEQRPKYKIFVYQIAY
jgi:4-amino-4-deoxy-L-arabinose transferase-like glycosyltransferase